MAAGNSINGFSLHTSRLDARSLARPRLRSIAVVVSLAAAAVGTTGCRDTLLAGGANPATAERHADELFGAFAARFDQVELGPKYLVARTQIAKSALVPSRVFDDSTVWDARPSATRRVMYVSGDLVDGHYRLELHAPLTPATRPGDSRHTISLDLLAPSVYRWDTNVDMGIGTITAEDVSRAIQALLRAPEGHTETQLRQDYAAAFPHAGAVWGRGFSIDSLHVAAGALGTTSVTVSIGFHPELMRPAFPDFAGYLDKYFGPAKYHFVLADRTGAPLMDCVGRNHLFTLRYRLQQGEFVSLFGPPRAWPASDSLELTSDMSMKIKVFTMGFHNLITDFVISNAGHERSWTIVARREPSWDLPLVTERLLRTPLQRPFEGAGSMFQVAIVDGNDGRGGDAAGAATQTLIARRTRLDVQESAILRFLGSLGSHAVSDLNARVEVEEDRFLRDGFVALQTDLRALAPSWRVRRDEQNGAALDTLDTKAKRHD